MRVLLLALGLCLLCVSAVHAQSEADYSRGATNTTVVVTASDAGTEVVSRIRAGARVGVPTGAAVPVCFAYVDSNIPCATGLTVPGAAEPCVPAGNGYLFVVQEERWVGKLCGILQSGAASVTVGVNAW